MTIDPKDARRLEVERQQAEDNTAGLWAFLREAEELAMLADELDD